MDGRQLLGRRLLDPLAQLDQIPRFGGLDGEAERLGVDCA
jgi:hypothetical protein